MLQISALTEPCRFSSHFESHVSRDEGEKSGGIISKRFNLTLFWQHLRGSHMPSGLGVAHGENKSIQEAFWWYQAIRTAGSARWGHSSNSDGDCLQAGSNGSAQVM